MSTDTPVSGSELVGLFLGAGASYELGMPLVWPLTYELTGWLVPEQLRALNAGWQSQGGGLPDKVIDDLAVVLARTDMHYESILGYLQTQATRFEHRDHRQAYDYLYAQLAELVYTQLYIRHVENEVFISRGMRYFEGIAGLAQTNAPLWIFSLNHDLMVECIAAHYDIPVTSGFPGTATLPLRDEAGKKIGDLPVAVITEEELKRSGMPFLQPGSAGINLLKIHGALDIFAQKDKTEYVKLLPLEPSVGGVLNTLHAAKEHLRYVAPDGGTALRRVINHITYEDDTGEIQFLRLSLLAGSYKYDQRHYQVLSQHFLKYFESNLNYVTKLICIGYGFGDLHINGVLRQWLEFTQQRRLVIVGPDVQIPPFLLHLAPQVRTLPLKATEFLEGYAERPLDSKEMIERDERSTRIAQGDRLKQHAAVAARTRVGW